MLRMVVLQLDSIVHVSTKKYTQDLFPVNLFLNGASVRAKIQPSARILFFCYWPITEQ